MRYNKGIIIIGRTYQNKGSINGPAGVISALCNEFKKKNVDYKLINYDLDYTTKVDFITRLISEVLFSRQKIVNVHTEGFLIPLLVFVISKLNKYNSYYLTVHGIHAMEVRYLSKLPNRKTLFIEKMLYKNFDNLICVSEMLKYDIERYFNRKKNIFVVNNGVYSFNVPVVEDRYKKNEIKLIMTGGLKRIKGIFDTLEIIRYVKECIPHINIILDIYGAAEDESTFNEYNEALVKQGLKDNIFYKGIIKDKKELYKLYSDADFNVALSHYDTFNVSVIESMMVGTPTISSSKCGASFLIEDEKDGYIVDLKLDYKNKIKCILNSHLDNRELYRSVRKNAAIKAQNYTWENSANCYLKLWEIN